VGSLLIVFGSIVIKLIELAPETRISSSLKLLSFRSALLLFLALYYYRITTTFLINNLYTKGYLLPFAKQVTKIFQVLVNYLLINL
jgi:hypothetical protein